MLEYLHLKNVGPAPEMELELAPRLNLLTGDNGLGKSFLLDIAWWALTRRWPAQVNHRLTSGQMARPVGKSEGTIEFRFSGVAKTESYLSRFDRFDQAWTGRAGRPANPGLVLYAQVDGSFAVWDPARNYWRKKGNVDVQDRPPAYVFSPREVWDGLPLEPGPKQCNGLIDDWAGWQKESGEAFKHFTSVLENLSPPDLAGRIEAGSPEAKEAEEVLRALGDSVDRLSPGELTRISLDDVRDIPTLKMPYKQDVPVVQASAGMRRIIALAYLLVWSWQEHQRASRQLAQETTRQIIFLIDEIEAHLHPRWQRTIVRSLLEVVNSLSPGTEVQLIATTHSPLVMASVEPRFDGERDSWFDLDLVWKSGTSEVQLNRREFVRQGDATNWLTSEAFDLQGAGSIEREQLLQKAADEMTKSTFNRKKAAALKAELVKVLPDTDDFWINWDFVGKKKGWLP